MDKDEFYKVAFTRNLGLVNESEQAILRRSRVAVAGCGGLGGRELIDLSEWGLVLSTWLILTSLVLRISIAR